MNPTPYDWQYLPLLLQILAAVFLGAAIVISSWFVGRHRNTKSNWPLTSAAFKPPATRRGRFSVRFYLVAVLFILFDVEMVFMMPWAVIYRQLPHTPVSPASSAFGRCSSTSAFVAVGLYYIVRKGILNWSHDRADL